MKKVPDSPKAFIFSIFSNIKKRNLLIFLLFQSLGQSLTIFLPLLLGGLIDAIYIKFSISKVYLIIFPLTWLFASFFLSLSQIFCSLLTQDVRKESKYYLFSRLITYPASSFISKDSGEINHLIEEVSFNIRYIFSETTPLFFKLVITVVASIALISFSSKELTAVFLLWLSAFIPISYYSSKKSVIGVSKSLDSSVEVSANIIDVFENYALIPSFGTAKKEAERFELLLKQEIHAYRKTKMRIDLSEMVQTIFLIGLPFLFCLFLIFSNDNLKITPGVVVTLFSFTFLIATQLGSLGKGILATREVYARLQQALKKIHLIKPENSYKKVISQTKPPMSWDISFEKVSFKYKESERGVTKLNLYIKEKEKIGIVGTSGSGKTTLLKLLNKHYKPQSGKIYFGENKIETIDTNVLAQNISYISQEIPLYHRSLRENLKYGNEKITDQEIWTVLKKAQIDEVIKNFPNQLDTKVGVKGHKLSGGEKARIAIAQAYLKKSKIIILDEALTSLDSESEFLLQKALENLNQDKTVIVVAHRLSTVKNMDRIIVMKKGEIVGDDTDKELSEKNLYYKRLKQLQILA